MAVTEEQTHNEGIANVASGSYLEDGTAAAFNLEVGFRPRYVKVVNATSGDQMEWFEGMDDAAGVKTVAAGTRSVVSSNGITVDERGFTVGLDTDVNVADEQLHWLALG